MRARTGIAALAFFVVSVYFKSLFGGRSVVATPSMPSRPLVASSDYTNWVVLGGVIGALLALASRSSNR